MLANYDSVSVFEWLAESTLHIITWKFTHATIGLLGSWWPLSIRIIPLCYLQVEFQGKKLKYRGDY